MRKNRCLARNKFCSYFPVVISCFEMGLSTKCQEEIKRQTFNKNKFTDAFLLIVVSI